MSSVFQPPPSWVLPVVVDKASGEAAFSPIWLRWFIDLSKNLGPGGAGSGIVINVTASGVLASSGGVTPNIVLSGIVSLANGGTAANSATGARTSLGLGTIAVKNVGATGSFTTVDAKTVTVTDGIIVSII